MGNIVSEKEIKNTTESLISNDKKRKNLKENSMIAVDGNGLIRVTNILRIIKQKDWDTKFFRVKIAQVKCKNLTNSIIKYIDKTGKKERNDERRFYFI